MSRNDNYINLNKIDEASNRNENNPIKLGSSFAKRQANIPEVFQEQPNYTDELNSAIKQFNTQNDLCNRIKNFLKSTDRNTNNRGYLDKEKNYLAALYLEFNCLMKIFRLTNEGNNKNEEFKNRYSNRFNEEWKQIKFNIGKMSPAQSKIIRDSMREHQLDINDDILMRPLPSPANCVSKVTQMTSFDDVAEGEKAKWLRYGSYTLCLVGVASAANGYRLFKGGAQEIIKKGAEEGAKEGAKQTAKEGIKEVVKEGVKQGAKEAVKKEGAKQVAKEAAKKLTIEATKQGAKKSGPSLAVSAASFMGAAAAKHYANNIEEKRRLTKNSMTPNQ